MDENSNDNNNVVNNARKLEPHEVISLRLAFPDAINTSSDAKPQQLNTPPRTKQSVDTDIRTIQQAQAQDVVPNATQIPQATPPASMETIPIDNSALTLTPTIPTPQTGSDVNVSEPYRKEDVMSTPYSDQKAVELIRSKIASIPPVTPTSTASKETFSHPYLSQATSNTDQGDIKDTGTEGSKLSVKPLQVNRHEAGERIIQPLHNIKETIEPSVPNAHTSDFDTYTIPSTNANAVGTNVQEFIRPDPELMEENHINTEMYSFGGKIKNIFNRFSTHVDNINDTKPSFLHKAKPAIKALGVGLLIFVIFNSQAIVGQFQYYTSSGSGDEIPSSFDPTETVAVSSESKIIIPKINVNVPVVYDVTSFDEKLVQKALERGVVHYGTTAVPGQLGNNVIVGHSSNNWWASGKYKFAFVLLDKLEIGDTFVLHYESKRYVYKVSKKEVVEADDLSVLTQTTNVPIVTLITCTPPGTSLKRLIVVAEQIQPEPAGIESSAPRRITENEITLPGNPPSLYQRFKRWIFE